MRTVRCYRRLGVQFERVLTDNGACYRSRSFRRLVRRVGMRHLRTRPYTPRTNGKAERLVQTSLREWAYAAATPTPNSEPTRCRAGFITTTGIDHMPALATGRPSPKSH